MSAVKVRRSGMRAGILGFVIFALCAAGVGYLLYWLLGSKPALLFPIWMSLFLAVIAPVTVIAIRHQIRLNRIKLIDLFAKTFKLNPNPPQSRAGGATTSDDDTNVSFEFVKGKYYVDLDLEDQKDPPLNAIPRFPMMLHADWMLLLCAVPFIAYSGFGVFLLFAPVIEILDPGASISLWLWPSILSLGGLPTKTIRDAAEFSAQHVNTLSVAALAFAGAYFYSIRLLMRSVAAFDLSPLTFLRTFVHTVLATTLAVVIYRVFPSAEGFFAFWRELGAAASNTTAATSTAGPLAADGVKSIWLIMAFALGFVPDAAIQYVLQRSGVKFKARYDELEDHTKTIPLTIIDGVDSFTAFRLEESNIFDVQNLATFNPIMLHIESPFGIYETIDWVAQAQLCTVVGPERFLMFKTINVRTIFDLERTVISEFADDNTIRLVGSILFTDQVRDKKLRNYFEFSDTYTSENPLIGKSSAGRENNLRSLSVNSIRHFVYLMVDDLHVHRLRQIWMLIGKELGAEYAYLSDTKARKLLLAEQKAA